MNMTEIIKLPSALFLVSMMIALPFVAQENNKDSETNGDDQSSASKMDPKRLCANRTTQPANSGTDVPIFYKTTWGNNPQEGEYRQEMERLLKSEIQNVKNAVDDIEKKHEALIQLGSYSKLSLRQTITLEDMPGVWRNNIYVSSKKVMVFHYKEDKKSLDCIVLDSLEKNIHNENEYTRKILRLYYPNVQSMEMETERKHFKSSSTLDLTSPEVQLRALRFVYLKLRSALYTMDMMIAAYYDKRNKLNYWQIDL